MSSQMHQYDAVSGRSTPSSSSHLSNTGAGPSTPSHMNQNASVYHPAVATQDAAPTSFVDHETHSPSDGSPLAANHPNPTAHPVYQAMYPEPDLPIANISRIMKRSLPENAKIAKDAKECIQDCVSELISFVTSEASDKCGAEKRKTINGDDVLYAMRVLGFDNYEEVLRVYLSRYRTAQEQNPRARRRLNPNNKSAASRSSAHPDDQDEDEDDGDDDDQDPAHNPIATQAASQIPTTPHQPPLPQRDAKLTMQNLLQD